MQNLSQPFPKPVHALDTKEQENQQTTDTNELRGKSCLHVNLCAGESEKVVLGNLIMKYYFPEVVSLLKGCVECYMTIVIYCVVMSQKLKSLISILWLKGHRNVNGRSWFRNSDHVRSMIRLTM